MHVLFLENEDSFSWNVVECLPCRRSEVVVRPGRHALDAPGLFDNAKLVIIGPGPTDPVRAGLVDVVVRAARARLPLLGICLGHQALGLAFGARLARCHPAHGKRAIATFGPSRMFPGVNGPEVVMRYHSLALADVASPLRIVAATPDGLPMAIEHRALPMAGLQFHPDSFATPGGRRMVASFFGAIQ